MAPNDDLYDFLFLARAYPRTTAGLKALMLDPDVRARFSEARADGEGKIQLSPASAVIVFCQPTHAIKNPAAVALGRLGGLARAQKLTPTQRQAIARAAGQKGGWPKGKPRKPKQIQEN